MKQLPLIEKSQSSKRRQEHGGHITLGRRRRKRPLDIKQPHHLVLRSDFAYGQRMLTRHRPLINRIIQKAKKRFDIKVYEFAIVSNHIHILAKGRSRSDLQNFFRVVAGHTAQEILRLHPIGARDQAKSGGGASPKSSSGTSPERGGAPLELRDGTPSELGGAPSPGQSKPRKTRERENKFWQTRIYSRIVSWGREFMSVKKYVIQNTLEALGVIAYQLRGTRNKPKRSKQYASDTS
jgi:REP element-mobilizing transposase RayT